MDRFSFASFQLLTTETMKRDNFLFMHVCYNLCVFNSES